MGPKIDLQAQGILRESAIPPWTSDLVR